jgi:amphi-Trp domain-containing protein
MMSDEIEAEQQLSRAEIPDYFEELAENLHGDDPVPVPVPVGFKTFYVDPPTTVIFEAEVEDEGEEVGSAERNIEFELKWQTQEGDAELEELSTIRQ